MQPNEPSVAPEPIKEEKSPYLTQLESFADRMGFEVHDEGRHVYESKLYTMRRGNWNISVMVSDDGFEPSLDSIEADIAMHPNFK